MKVYQLIAELQQQPDQSLDVVFEYFEENQSGTSFDTHQITSMVRTEELPYPSRPGHVAVIIS